MKKIIATAAIMFCLTNTNAQYHRIERDTIEILTYDSLGNEYHSNPPRYLIRKTEIGDTEYWRSKERYHKWSLISICVFIIGTLVFSAAK